MIVNKNENIRPFDIDGCLVFVSKDLSNAEIVEVVDPVNAGTITMHINKNMVRLLLEEHQRGGYILVWSRGGWEWARNVVLALGLDDYVHEVMSKPLVYFDDTPVTKWMKDRVFIGPDERYKE